MGKGKKIDKNDNFLELIPIKSDKISSTSLEDDLVQIIIPRDGIMDKVVRSFFKTPKVMKIDLDQQGSCVWNAIDGERNIDEIGIILKEKFGKDAEPLYQRLGTYINLLRNNKFITLEKVRD